MADTTTVSAPAGPIIALGLGLAAAIALMTANPARAAGPDPAIVAKIDAIDARILRPLLTDPALIAAIQAQNQTSAALSDADIMALDTAWRAEVGTATTPTISKVQAVPASALLRDAKAASEGLIAEIFAMDDRGLNVAMSDVTSDYWQGDEAKWQETFLKGADARHLSDVDFDESTQSYTVQVSLPVVDPATAKPIGAVTFGIDVEALDAL